MYNRPSNSEVAEITGYNLPIEEISEFPTAKQQQEGGYILKYIGRISDTCDTFLKTAHGKVVAIILLIHGIIGFARDAFDGATYIYNASAPMLERIETFVFSHKNQEVSPEYLVLIPKETHLTLPVKDWADFPAGTQFAPASSIDYT